MFYNTTNETGATLQNYKVKAQNQEQAIYDWFRRKQCFASPSQVTAELFLNTIPVTSTRRAMKNLTDEGKLIKCDEKIIGPYGRPEHLWILGGAKP